MQPSTRRGWRGALLAVIVIVWLYGTVLVSLGGYPALAIFTLVLGLLAAAVTWATRDRGAHLEGQ